MRISARGRYALAATASMAARYATGENITVASLAERLGISKIYLEQVFSLLKKADIVASHKGAQGGYRLSRGRAVPPLLFTE
ncbi:MAG TPA: Rrf2 family transcriptional regulator, partial [Candidatus Limiplasma sp.]|nr:Rrf2 family transcriptional regulator [Candidatus Limiplasma sp.]